MTYLLAIMGASDETLDHIADLVAGGCPGLARVAIDLAFELAVAAPRTVRECDTLVDGIKEAA